MLPRTDKPRPKSRQGPRSSTQTSPARGPRDQSGHPAESVFCKVKRDLPFSPLYAERNLVEPFFQLIKEFRRIATCYEKAARYLLEASALGSARLLGSDEDTPKTCRLNIRNLFGLSAVTVSYSELVTLGQTAWSKSKWSAPSTMSVEPELPHPFEGRLRISAFWARNACVSRSLDSKQAVRGSSSRTR